MISKMIRYDIVLHVGEQKHFIDELREIGLVDITTTGWEPSDKDRQRLSEIDAYGKSIEWLEAFKNSDNYASDAAPYDLGAEAFDAYVEAQQRRNEIVARIAQLEKQAQDIAPWGDFSKEAIIRLASEGVEMRFFMAQPAAFALAEASAEPGVTIVEINRTQSLVYFAVIASKGVTLSIDGQEAHLPECDAKATMAQIETLRMEDAKLNSIFSRAAASLDALRMERGSLMEQLQGVQVGAMAQREADGQLLVMEGWAEAETAERVDKLLEEYPNLVYMKRDATIDDEAPVKLKNNKFARLFELIGAMYALPKYGTFDLTAIFGPFYMLFFAICLCDAGYGLVLLLVGIALLMKGGPKLRQAALLSIVCASATVAFGFYANSFFGLAISDYAPVIKFLDFQNQFFSLALALGVVQILFGMFLNICLQTKLFGFTSTFGLLGWFIILLSGCVAVGLPMLNENLTISWFSSSSPAFYAAMGVGAVLMLLLNNIKRNPIINFGSGLWNAYNNITGLLSDVLSYIRLFAIGLSGGVLAQVFNSLALGLTGLDAGIESFGVGTVFQIIGAAAILLVGHGINLFMSAISSFVHPMRLTFVEFYKNAGFEMTTRSFEPLTSEKK